ncbi:MAG: NAD(P)/FAD-dependent oxidoreductase, partial [Candidatus Babeliales bacterium]
YSYLFVVLDIFYNIYRISFIYSLVRYSRYPYIVNLFGLPKDVIAECIEGFVARSTSLKKTRTFPEWVDKNFGTGFARHFFLPYQKKIFAYDLDDITASWTGRFVPQTSLREMILGALEDRTNDAIGYNAHFYYPKQGGIQYWILKLAQALKKPINTLYNVNTIDIKNKVIEFTNGHTQKYDILISTMPLDTLITKIKELPSTRFKTALEHLACNAVINFNLGVARNDLSEKHWIYFPEEKYPFYRIGFPHNLATSMAPEGCSSLYGEFAHIGKSHDEVQTMLKQALAQTKKVLKIDQQDILTEKIITIPHAYVIYNTWREKYLPHLHVALHKHAVYSIGRYGEWKYASMQEAVLDGKKIVDDLTVVPAKTAFYQEQTATNKHRKEAM